MANDSHLDELRAEGTLVARGEFELDRQKAREKLGEFQLADPHHYVLELVIAGHLLGADPIRVDVHTNELEVVLENVSLTTEALEHLYDRAFSDRTDRRSRGMWHLALGLTAVEGLHPQEVCVRSIAAGQRSVLRQFDAADELEVQPDESGREALEIHVREPFRPAHIIEFFERQAHRLPEQVALRTRCRHSSRAVYLDGDRVSRGMQLPEQVRNRVAFQTPLEHGVVGLIPNRDEVVVEILQHGLKVTEHRLPARLCGAHLVVETTRLTKDLSRDSFVRNDGWQQFREHLVSAAIYKALQDFLPGFTDKIWIYGSYERWLRRLAVEARYDLEQGQPDCQLGELPEALAEVARITGEIEVWDPVMDRGDWRQLSLSEILQRSAGRRLYFSRRRYIKTPTTGAVALHLPDGPPARLDKVVHAPLINLTPQ